MTRRMTEADWLAIARVSYAIHQRRAAAGAVSSGDDRRKTRLREMAVQNARTRREAAARTGGGHDETTS